MRGETNITSVVMEGVQEDLTGIIKVIRIAYTNITINSAGEVAVAKPSAQSGYEYIGGIPFTYNGTTGGGVSYMNGYIQGPPNKTINTIVINHIFVKTDMLTLVT